MPLGYAYIRIYGNHALGSLMGFMVNCFYGKIDVLLKQISVLMKAYIKTTWLVCGCSYTHGMDLCANILFKKKPQATIVTYWYVMMTSEPEDIDVLWPVTLMDFPHKGLVFIRFYESVIDLIKPTKQSNGRWNETPKSSWPAFCD